MKTINYIKLSSTSKFRSEPSSVYGRPKFFCSMTYLTSLISQRISWSFAWINQQLSIIDIKINVSINYKLSYLYNLAQLSLSCVKRSFNGSAKYLGRVQSFSFFWSLHPNSQSVLYDTDAILTQLSKLVCFKFESTFESKYFSLSRLFLVLRKLIYPKDTKSKLPNIPSLNQLFRNQPSIDCIKYRLGNKVPESTFFYMFTSVTSICQAFYPQTKNTLFRGVSCLVSLNERIRGISIKDTKGFWPILAISRQAFKGHLKSTPIKVTKSNNLWITAETEGFEPSRPLEVPDDLEDRCFRPLSHVSVLKNPFTSNLSVMPKFLLKGFSERLSSWLPLGNINSLSLTT